MAANEELKEKFRRIYEYAYSIENLTKEGIALTQTQISNIHDRSEQIVEICKDVINV